MTTPLIPAHASRPETAVPDEVLLFHASNVIGTTEIEVSVGPATKVAAVTDSIARRMSLPAETVFGLRDDDSSVYLDDDKPIGEQIEPGTRVSVVPRAHLGSGALDPTHAACSRD